MQGKSSAFASVVAPPVRTLDALSRAARSVCENLEGRTLMSADPLAHQSDVVTLPYVLDFNAPVNGLHDKDGTDIGFTRVQVNKKGLASSYVASLLDLDTAAGVLKVTTSGNSVNGSNYNGDNTLVNALETTFDSTTAGFQVTTRIKGPLGFINLPSEQTGIYFGPDQDNYIKLVAIAREEGMRLQFLDEQTYGGVYTHSLNSIVNVGDLKNIQTLDLRLEGDAGSGKVRAYYSINGATFVKMPTELALSGEKRAAFFSKTTKAGLMTLHKNDSGPMTVTYDRFEIQPGKALAGRPTVVTTRPGDGATDVRRDAFVAADLNLPNAGIDVESLNGNTVKLYRTSDRSIVPAVVNTSGGGDTIVLQPTTLLDPNTQYTFEVTDGVKDQAGGEFISYQSTFTTGTEGADTDPSLSFEKVSLPSTYGEAYSSVKVGPDGKLYASTETGKIFRWNLNADGTLGTVQVITAIQDANVGPRLITGFAFDPTAPANAPVLWVNHGVFDIVNAPDWSTKVTKLSGPNLDVVRDVVVGLPRAARDHISNQPSFGPDGAYYFPQGSNSAMGAPDVPWGNRPERLLSAAIMSLDPSKLPATGALDVKTQDGGTYNPYAPGASLTIYASGIRNAYDLVWTKDGRLYAATNGSAAGGNTWTNSSGGVIKINTTQNDYLFLVEQGGYYGHPNPLRNEFIMNGGNPTANVDPNEVPEYPVGTMPEANYRGSVFDFGKNYSPNGTIEYQNANAFNGALEGKLMTVRFSGGDDIIVLTKDAAGKITQSTTGIAGMRNFIDPLDVVENTANGYLYVAEYAESDHTQAKITLLRPIPPGAKATVDKSMLVFSDVSSTASTGGAGSSKTLTVRVTNTGTVPLSFPSDSFTVLDDPNVDGNDAGRFTVVNRAAIPDTIGVGEFVDVQVNYTANAVRIQSAILRVKSNDASKPFVDVTLRGVGTAGTGGANEPSLARILRAYNIPTVVGDGSNDSGETTTDYTVHSSSQEVLMPRLQKAGAGGVSIQLLASMAKADASGAVASRFGYYAPGSRQTKTELFNVNGADAQTLNPTANGATSFDPGSAAFSLYGIFPAFVDATKDKGMPREVYSEDALNTWEGTASNRHKVRFFPLKNADGSVAPNAFVFTFEEYDVAFDSNDIVGIIRNVQAAPAGGEIGIENKEGLLFNDRLMMSRIENTHPGTRIKDGQTYQPPDNKVRDTATVIVRNTGSDPLVLTSFTITPGTKFQLVNPPAAGTTLAAGASVELTVKFIATSGRVSTGALTINSSDQDEPVTTVQLVGFWQPVSEDGNEPSLQEMVTAFGFKTTIANPGELLTIPGQQGKIMRVGDEVLSPYWRSADTSTPVTVRQIASFHGQGSSADLYWHKQGSESVTKLFTSSGNYGQSFLPMKDNDTSPAYAQFSPTTAFGWRVAGREWSDPTKNPAPEGQPQDQGHHVRFWVARDGAGKIIPNTFIMSMDYSGINYDYQDNVYLVTGIKPVSPPAAPTALTANGSGGGIALNWNDSSEANLAGYNVYRSASATGTFTKVNANLLSESQFNDIFAPAGTTSYYRVVAVDLSGNESSPATASANRSGDSVPPSKPVALGAVGSSNGITLDWADNAEPDLAGYEVWRGASANGPFTRLNSSLIASSNFVDLAAPVGQTMYYQVFADDQAGNKSTAATANGARAAGEAPVAPSGLTADVNGSSSATLNWSASAGTATYRVERRVAGGSFAEIAAGLTGTTYTDNGLAAGTTYEYAVRAVGTSGGVSAQSNVATATTPTVTTAYSSVDVGAAGPGGATNVVNADTDFDLTAGTGTNVSGTADAVRFLHKQMTGDFDVKVRVATLVQSDPTAKAGIMVRESLSAGSKTVFAAVTPAEVYRLAVRSSTDGSVSSKKTGASTPDSWVRLNRTGTTFAAYYSENGTTWTKIGQSTVALPSTVYFGLALGSASATATTTAQFRSFGETSGTTPTPPPTPTPTPTPTPILQLSGSDIGSPVAGTTTVVTEGSAYDVTGGGADVYGTQDSFRFVSRQVTGDFDVAVQVQSLAAASATAKAGLMARSTLDANSANVFSNATLSSTYRLSVRAAAGGTTSLTKVGAPAYPNVCLRLTRVGNTFTGYYSTDGVNWTKTSSTMKTLPATLHVGMAVTSNDATQTATAQFRNLSGL